MLVPGASSGRGLGGTGGFGKIVSHGQPIVSGRWDWICGLVGLAGSMVGW